MKCPMLARMTAVTMKSSAVEHRRRVLVFFGNPSGSKYVEENVALVERDCHSDRSVYDGGVR